MAAQSALSLLAHFSCAGHFIRTSGDLGGSGELEMQYVSREEIRRLLLPATNALNNVGNIQDRGMINGAEIKIVDDKEVKFRNKK